MSGLGACSFMAYFGHKLRRFPNGADSEHKHLPGDFLDLFLFFLCASYHHFTIVL
jgi:hypothetical protein